MPYRLSYEPIWPLISFKGADIIPNLEDSIGEVDVALRDLGQRLAKIRLARNQTQESLAQQAGTSISSIKRLEAGQNTSLETLVRLLMALKLEDSFKTMLPDPEVRPIERVRFQGRQRQRASERKAPAKATDWAWNDEGEE